MTYLQRNSEVKKNRKKKAIISLVIITVLVTGLFFRKESADLAHKILFPVNTVFSMIVSPFSNIPTYFSSKTNLQNQNDELENKIRMQNIELLSIKAIKDQNIELRQILNLQETESFNRVVAQVILTPPFSPFDTIVVRISDNYYIEGQDVNQRVQIGNPVFIQNILVGEVFEIHDKNFIIELYSTHGKTMPVRINNEIIAEAEGQGGLSFKIELPRDIELQNQAPIFSMNLPESIIGFIEQIETTDASSFQTIYFQYPLNFNNFNFVEIGY